MSHAYRVLRVSFETREELDREYAANLVNGGLFIPGPHALLYGEAVVVFVDLLFSASAVEFEGRVVQSIPAEFEANGGRIGVSVELSSSPLKIRACLEEAISGRFEDEASLGTGNRCAPRSVAHVRARVSVPGAAEIEGRTRNLSLAGVLVAIGDEAPPVGQDVIVAIAHPVSGKERSISGTVARHDLDRGGQIRAIGIQFSVDPGQKEETIDYLSRVKASEHARRLGGITGSIDTLGLNDLILSFGQCIPRGQFTLMNAGEVGTIHVADGLMVFAQVGAARGVKALVRMAEWEDGNFDLHPNPSEEDLEDDGSMSLPIEMALIEAARLIDESRTHRASGLPRDAGLCVTNRTEAREDADLSKIETLILDLAEAGTTVARLLDMIQEPDGLIERNILALVEQGILQLEDGS